MSAKRSPLKIFLMKGAWSVEVPEALWKEVSEWCKKKKDKGYSVQEKWRGTKIHRIWVRTLGHLMDLINK
jgi:hypothetical protein